MKMACLSSTSCLAWLRRCRCPSAHRFWPWLERPRTRTSSAASATESWSSLESRHRRFVPLKKVFPLVDREKHPGHPVPETSDEKMDEEQSFLTLGTGCAIWSSSHALLSDTLRATAVQHRGNWGPAKPCTNSNSFLRIVMFCWQHWLWNGSGALLLSLNLHKDVVCARPRGGDGPVTANSALSCCTLHCVRSLISEVLL